jgi:polysaccharide biosynthesis transport protein
MRTEGAVVLESPHTDARRTAEPLRSRNRKSSARVELHEYLGILRKRWIAVTTIVLLAVAAAAAASLVMAPVYSATTQVFVSVRGGSTTSDLLQGSSFTRQQVRSYVDMVATPIVLEPVVDRLDLAEDAADLEERVTADSPPDTVLINIRVSGDNPQDAAATANAIAASFRSAVSEVETPEDGSSSPVKISVLREARAPEQPSSPNIPVNLALGLMVGVAVGLAYVVLRERLNTTVHGVEDVEKVTGTSVIATFPRDNSAERSPLTVQEDPHGQRAEAFRRLRTNLRFLTVSGRPQSIVITSALPGEGKTTTTINLALAIADTGTSVIIVDADLRRPSVADYMGLEGNAGLTSVLIGAASVAEVAQTWSSSLSVLPSGPVPPNPSELLGSEAMERLLSELAKVYEVVLVDAPPLLPVTDAAVVAGLTSGAIVVAGAGRVHRPQLREAIHSLGVVDARVLGLVLNRVEKSEAENYSYYSRYTAHSAGNKDHRRRRRSRRSPAGESLIAPSDAERPHAGSRGGLPLDEKSTVDDQQPLAAHWDVDVAGIGATSHPRADI